jgi:hypothetical protein
MGVCDGAYAVLEQVFQNAGVTEFDYAAGYEMMLGMMDELQIAAAQSGEPGHDTAQGWLKWCYELRNRPEAIMYFGDHIEEKLFRPPMGICTKPWPLPKIVVGTALLNCAATMRLRG